MQEVKAPNKIPAGEYKKVFLAGSIEMGTADNWQERVVQALKDADVIILNPRRDDWNSNWSQRKDNPDFREQVEWELNALDKSDHIIMYFDPATKSPISLLELGLYARSGKLLVVCPDDFWRKGNVDIICEQYGVHQFGSLEDLLKYLIPQLN